MTTSVVRRLYMYAAAFLGLQMLAAGTRQMLRQLLETVFPGDVLGRDDLNVEQLSYSVALLVVGLVLWAIHWSWAQRGLREPEEQHAALRRLYGYLVLLVAAISLLFNLRGLIDAVLSDSSFASTQLSATLAGILVNGPIWAYHWQIIRKDRLTVEATGVPATLRRWYLALTQALSLGVASLAAVELVQLLLDSFTPAFGSNSASGLVLAGLVAGLLIWLPHELWARRLLRIETPLQADEARSTLRQVYAALVITAAAVALLGGLALLLYGLLRLVIGGATWAMLRADQIEGLSVVIVAAPLWWYHRAALAQQAQISAVVTRVETARRVIGYLTAAVGLVALFFGLGGLLSTLLRLALGQAALAGSWQDPLSFNLALSIVALPVYSTTILSLERLVAGSAEEQRTLARRIYLYGALLFGIVTLISAGVVLLQLLLGGLLSVAATDRLADIGGWLGYALIGLAITSYHITLLRRSGAVRADTSQGQTIALLAEAPLRDLLAATIARELPGATIRELELDDLAALRDVLPEAQVLVAPLAVALSGPQAAMIASFQGRRLLLATAVPGAELIGARHGEAALAREAARALRTHGPAAPSAPPAAPALPQGAA